ncbi:PadR family transcriptional regulator [Amycolatopsis sp. WAC 01375]|uniref:PadR family transcriptional regulator n=1 Tax=unclassified Amycolatopsis TaxID=2618356 RepID=UPI000F7AD1BE|nr:MULTISPECIES: PadR family transcriptional regulator [unclassified Amycolatopsis]RSM82709.1 PadR family transcriptional regulator [Amycolatopsis sp. WAC 01375]RSN34532.1 PadR family transcriptional regulator [Amycolatopsis sp. WAC 01416]
MALRNAILATLLDGEFSGYDLAKSFNASVANFWTATPQQLYRELDKMEAQGLVAARVVEQRRRPNKRLFSLTDAGAAELAEFTTRAPKPTAIRDELLVRIQAVEAGDDKAVRRAVADRMATAETKLKRFERLRERLLGEATEVEFLATAPRVGPYLTLARGMAFEQENIRWCAQVLAVLDRRATANDGGERLG